jgi:hypothetical protein
LYPAPAQTAGELPKVALTISSGAPLRLYLTKRIPKRAGAPVEGKLIEGMFAFDREVLPAGTAVLGEVDRVQPVAKWQRIRAILNGDFTPLRQAQVEFTTLVLPDGRRLSTRTVETMGLNSIYREPSPKKRAKAGAGPESQNNGVLGTAKQTAKDRLNVAINSRSRGIADIVRGPDKKERFVDFLWSKLPYHPQYVRRGTRFDAPLREALEFGFAEVKAPDLTALGSQPPVESTVHARLLTALDSGSAKVGEEVKAEVSAPLFSPDHKLIYPQGTLLTGTVVVAKRARLFHRPGVLRFNFQKVDLPPDLEAARSVTPAALATRATLDAAEGSHAPVKVDSEGGVQAKESKTRFLAPAISLVLASRAADNDAGRHNSAGGAGEPNVSGRTLGGGMGFGMLGALVSQSSRYVGMAFGYYGLAWSVYSSVVARGGEVQFDKNAVMEIKFGTRKPAQGSKLLAAEGGAPQ